MKKIFFSLLFCVIFAGIPAFIMAQCDGYSMNEGNPSSPCEKISNGGITCFESDVCTNTFPFWNNMIPKWKPSHGEPFMSFANLPGGDCQYDDWGNDIVMTAIGIGPDHGKGSGVFQNVSVVEGRIYFLQYDYRVNNSHGKYQTSLSDFGPLRRFYVKFANGLYKAPTANNIGSVPSASESLIIQYMTNVPTSSSYSTATQCIKADHNWSSIWFYPTMENSYANNSAISIKNIKLYEVSAGNDADVGCSGTYSIGQGCATIPGATYSWSPSTGLSNTNTLNPTVNLSAISGTITYTLTVTVNGCSQTDQITLTQTQPIVNLGPDQLICYGQSVILNAGNPGLNYLWSNGATTQTITANTIGNYCVTVTNPNTGCASSDCVNIGLYKSPNPAFTYNQSCVNCTEQISVTATYWPSYTHNWELWSSNSSGDFISLLDTGSGMTYTFSSGLTYNAYFKVKHIIIYPCGRTTSSHLVSITPTWIDPEFDLVKVAGETNDHYHLQATAHSIPTCAQFWWRISDITNGTPVDVMLNPSNWWASSQIPSTWFPGYCCNPSQTIGEGTFYYGRIYRIERGVWSGCSPWTSYYTDFTASFGKGQNGDDLQIIASGSVVNNMDVKGLADNALRFYPNPSEGILNLEYDFAFVSGTSITIVNSLGQEVYSNDRELPAAIDLTGQSRGVYYVKLKYKDNVLVKKLLLQ